MQDKIKWKFIYLLSSYNSYLFFCIFLFEINKILKRSYTASKTPADDNLNNNFNSSDYISKATEPQAFDDIAVPLPTLELSEEQKYIKFYQLILATEASNPNLGFHEGGDEHLRRRYYTMSGRQQNFIRHILQAKYLQWLTTTGKQDTWHLTNARQPTVAILLAPNGFGCHLYCPLLREVC